MFEGNCSVEGCTRPIRNQMRMLCNTHYIRYRRHGDVQAEKPPIQKPPIRKGIGRNRGQARARRSWRAMMERCTTPSNHNYCRYGGAGITVCDRWMDSFENFLADMGERPEGMTLDRIDVRGNYEPDNCRWADPSTQAKNQRTNIRNTSGHRGVSLNRHDKKWYAYTQVNKKRIFLGAFRIKEEAIAARHEATLDDIGVVEACCEDRARLAAQLAAQAA